MAKRKVIEHVYIRGVEDIVILYDVEEQIFKARVFDIWLEEKLQSDLKKKIIEEVEKVVSGMFNWIPIIEVKENYSWGEDPMVSYVGFEIDRYYVAQKESGKWLKSRWGDKEKASERYRTCEGFKDVFEIPFEEQEGYRDNEKIFYMHYDEAKWIGFGRLTDAIKELKLKLRKLVGTEKGQQRISKLGGLLLVWKEKNGTDKIKG